MARGLGAVQLLDRLPDAVTAVAGLATQLGDTWFLFVGIGLLVVVGTRERSFTNTPVRDCAYLFALVIGASSLTVVLKHGFALPRPPGAATATPPAWLPAAATAIYESAVTGHGYGFPSGHALTTTAVYGGAAFALDVWDRERRLVLAGAATALVAGSRVALGVHYAVDVVVGIALGAGFLAGAVRLTDQRPAPALFLATLLAALAFAAAGTTDSALAFSTTAVGLVAWVGASRLADFGWSGAEG